MVRFYASRCDYNMISTSLCSRSWGGGCLGRGTSYGSQPRRYFLWSYGDDPPAPQHVSDWKSTCNVHFQVVVSLLMMFLKIAQRNWVLKPCFRVSESYLHPVQLFPCHFVPYKLVEYLVIIFVCQPPSTVENPSGGSVVSLDALWTSGLHPPNS